MGLLEVGTLGLNLIGAKEEPGEDLNCARLWELLCKGPEAGSRDLFGELKDSQGP